MFLSWLFQVMKIVLPKVLLLIEYHKRIDFSSNNIILSIFNQKSFEIPKLHL